MPRISGKSAEGYDLALLGKAIRARRKLVGMSQEAFADEAEIDRSHMGKIERGERNVTFLNLQRIARALRCRLSDLLIEAGL